MNKELLDKYWVKYKADFGTESFQKSEAYKWNLFNQMYSIWNWKAGASNKDMYTKTFQVDGPKNLWQSGNFFPISMLTWMWEKFPVDTEQALNLLFDEKIDLAKRITEFTSILDTKLPELAKLITEKPINHHYHGDLRAISIYLTLQFPEKYFLYKHTVFKDFSISMNLPPVKTGKTSNYLDYLIICKELREFIQSDNAFLSTYNTYMSNNNLYSDPYLHLLIQDFMLFTMSQNKSKQVSDGCKFWIYAPGEQAKMWPELYEENEMAIAWDEIGDLSKYNSKAEIENALNDGSNLNKRKTNDSLACYEFASEIEIGDVIIAKKGTKEYIGWGIVTSEYFYDETKSSYKSRRRVSWKNQGGWIDTNGKIVLKTLTDITKYPEYVDRLSKLLNIQLMNDSKKSNTLNQILYGPPGTGKTYNTIDKAINIIDPTFNFNIERKDILEEFHKHLKKGNIFFTTFHQSMSYEDFIEGIKPSKSNDGGLTYEIEDGIFKLACANAGYLCYKKSIENSSEIKSYTFDNLYDAFIDYYQEQLDNQQLISLKTLTGKEVTIIDINSNNSIKARALNSIATKNPAPLTKENLQKLYDKFSNVSEITNLKQVQETVEVTPRTTEFYAVFKGLKDFENKIFKPDELEVSSQVEVIDDMDKLTKFNAGVFKNAIKQFSKITEPIVLIIDEINRGNVSAIFGELITLIEDSKRLGADEFLEITLPYSKKKFSVPHNLHIIGTMNTADRSVEALDTALRRRFSFVEMLPDATKLNGKEIQGIHLELLLTAINERIEVLVDRDHTIGHAFFINTKDINDLRFAFGNKIIPLLQEYFYGNYQKMEMVIGSAFFKITEANKVKFAVKTEDFDADGKVYHILDVTKPEVISDEAFIEALNNLIQGV